jgi:hypothetical protein
MYWSDKLSGDRLPILEEIVTNSCGKMIPIEGIMLHVRADINPCTHLPFTLK